MDVRLSRQPIFDATEDVAAYRILHHAAPLGPEYDAAAAQRLLVDVFLNVGLPRLTNGRRGSICATPQLLGSGLLHLLDPAAVLLEVPAEPLNDSAIEACRVLRDAGYTLVADAQPGRRGQVEDCATVLRVDVEAFAPGELEDFARIEVASGRTLLAANVRSRTERSRLAAHGVQLFQGFEFSRPENVRHRGGLSPGQLNALQIMRRIRDIDTADAEIEEVFRGDVELSWKLLRMVNSAAVGFSGITSIEHAVRVLGREALYRWLMLLFMTGDGCDGARREVLHTALLRARMCELIGGALQRRDQRASLYIVGLLSVIDLLFGAPLDELVDSIGLAESIRAALLRRDGFHGAVLRVVEAWDAGDWDGCETGFGSGELSSQSVTTLYLEALCWAAERLPDLRAA